MQVAVDYFCGKTENNNPHPTTYGATIVMGTARRHSGKYKPESRGVVRVIGGRWRGRKLPFTASDGLRPTPDRVRETLFNWLAGDIEGARCVDLFAGSGALGLEALSRGAASCDFVDSSPQHCQQIHNHLVKLGAGATANVVCTDGLEHLTSINGPVDILFLDPPFAGPLLEQSLTALAEGSFMAATGAVYLEFASDTPSPPLPSPWILDRDKRAGQVAYRLYRR
jgi:16S rRNA (guanine966-N2)-methyltransferase